MNRRRGCLRPEVEDGVREDDAELPAKRGSARRKRPTSRSSWAQRRDEGVAVAAVVLAGAAAVVSAMARRNRGERRRRVREVGRVPDVCRRSSVASRWLGEGQAGSCVPARAVPSFSSAYWQEVEDEAAPGGLGQTGIGPGRQGPGEALSLFLISLCFLIFAFVLALSKILKQAQNS